MPEKWDHLENSQTEKGRRRSIVTLPPQVPVVHVATSGLFGGMERLMCQLAGGLVARGGQARVLFPRSSFTPQIAALCESTGVPVAFTDAGIQVERSAGWKHTLRSAQLLREGGPCILHFHYGESFLSLKHIIAARLAGFPCIASLHGVSAWKRAGGRKRTATLLASRLCERLIANSRATARSVLESGADPERLEVIPCGVPDVVRQTSRDEARRRLGMPQQAFVVASVGRLVAQKCIDDLIRAIAAEGNTTAGGRPVLLAVAGEGPERSLLEALAAQLGVSAHFFGLLSDVSDLYAAADIFALPSEQEAFGLVYVEAALHGLPSIGVGEGGVPDVIQDGQTGLLVPGRNVPALWLALKRLQNDAEMRLRMGEAARCYARANFTLDRMVDRFCAVYDAAYPGHRGGGWMPESIVFSKAERTERQRAEA